MSSNDPDDIVSDEEDYEKLDELPDFANDENKILHAQVQAKETLLTKTKDELEENTERVSIIHEHLKNIQQEHLHTQALVDAKNKDIQAEVHITKLSEREMGRIKQDIKKINSAINSTEDRLNSCQNDIFQCNEKLEKFRLQMNWNEEELLQWSLAAKQKDEDKQALEKYQAMDDRRVADLTLKMEKMVMAVEEKRKEHRDEDTKTQSLQIELDKIHVEFKREHKARQDMVVQWRDAMEAIHRRDQAIAQTGANIGQLKAHIRQQEAELRAANDFLAREAANNKAVEGRIEAQSRHQDKKRQEVHVGKRSLDEFSNEVEANRHEVEKAERDLRQTENMNAALVQLKSDKLARLAEFTRMVETQREHLTVENERSSALAMEAGQIDKIFKEHQALHKKTTKELHQMKESMFKHSHQLFELRKAEADLIAEISGSQGTSRNLQSRIQELDQRSLKQQEMLYNIEFQVQQLERKVSFASGKRSLEQTLEMKKEIQELNQQLEAMTQQHQMIANQVKRLHEDLRAAKRSYNAVMAEKQALEDRIAAIELENTSEVREMKSKQKEKQQLIVDHDVLKLSVKRLRDTLRAKADQVFALENRKLQLQLSMKEREKEIQMHRDIQRAEQKAAEEARHKLTVDLKERQLKVDKLRKKYATIAGRLHKTEEGEEGEKSQAYYIIAAAQEREALQKEGDELNRVMRQTEKEIMLLERTLNHLSNRNQNFRHSLQKADDRGPEAKLHKQLEKQHRNMADDLFKQKNYLREITADFENRHRLLADLINNIGGVHAEVQQREKEAKSVVQSLSNQDQAIAAAERVLEDKKQEYRKWSELPEGQASLQEMDMEHKQLNARIKTILKMITALIAQHKSLKEPVNDVLEGVGLELNPNTGVRTAMSSPLSRAARNQQRGGPPRGQRAGRSDARSRGRGKETDDFSLPPVTPGSRGGRKVNGTPNGISRTPAGRSNSRGNSRSNSRPVTGPTVGRRSSKPNSRPGSTRRPGSNSPSLKLQI